MKEKKQIWIIYTLRFKGSRIFLVKDSNFQKQRKTVRGSQKVRLALFCK